jgi:N-dimethylarginine dimethylaminohydrolase
MPKPKINHKVLMSSAEYFSVEELNPYSNQKNQPNVKLAQQEHQKIAQALETAGVEVINVKSPKNCQDGIYTANWALIKGNKAMLSNLPNKRRAEQPHARAQLKKLEFKLIEAPYKFSGQGDALPCGNLLFCGQTYRTDKRMHQFISDKLGFKVVSLETVPLINEKFLPVINKITGWPDSYFYDIDLALAVIQEDLIAWCPEAFVPTSQEILRKLPLKQIHVSLEEAIEGFACNLVSTGKTVVMSNKAPKLQQQLKAHGLKTITPNITELSKGGGYIRCTTLTV